MYIINANKVQVGEYVIKRKWNSYIHITILENSFEKLSKKTLMA